MGYDVGDEAGQMVGRKAITKPNAGIESRFIIYGFELSAYGKKYDTLDARIEMLSPKLGRSLRRRPHNRHVGTTARCTPIKEVWEFFVR